MKFCPKCGIMLTLKGAKFVCSRCGHEEGPAQIMVREKMAGKPAQGKGVLDKSAGEALPVMEGECLKCKNKKLYFWSLQTRAGDEGETSFFKCTKCGHTWRSYK